MFYTHSVMRLDLETNLYSAEAVRAIDKKAIHSFNITGNELMARAGQAAFEKISDLWPHAISISIICGPGNNGGDGYVIARLASNFGYKVKVLQLGDASNLAADAKFHFKLLQNTDVQIYKFEHIGAADLIIDAVFGTGLKRKLEGKWLDAVESINKHPADVFAIDIPTGLNSDTGAVMGNCVKALATISFVALKQGMFTAKARDYCGDIYFDSLRIPQEAYKDFPPTAKLLYWDSCRLSLPQVKRSSHKNQRGHVLIVGGAPGYSGAVILAAKAAMRTGAGLVSVATHPGHTPYLNINFPEMIVGSASNSIEEFESMISKAHVVVLGPGLGSSEWSQKIFTDCIQSNKPLVIDADGLNLLAKMAEANIQSNNTPWILTPHPGEAARLLKTEAKEIELNRFLAIREICKKFKSSVVLKGAGTLIATENTIEVCPYGNPSMATAGSGDVLSGIIGALVAGGLEADKAAQLGVCLHAKAGDIAEKHKGQGMIASDIIDRVPEFLINGATGSLPDRTR